MPWAEAMEDWEERDDWEELLDPVVPDDDDAEDAEVVDEVLLRELAPEDCPPSAGASAEAWAGTSAGASTSASTGALGGAGTGAWLGLERRRLSDLDLSRRVFLLRLALRSFSVGREERSWEILFRRGLKEWASVSSEEGTANKR